MSVGGHIRVMVVDDHALFRRGLISLLEEMPEFLVVGEASNGSEALGKIEQAGPDVLLLDINMPVMDGIQAIESIRKLRPEQKNPDADHFPKR
jgi:YesN/AraC family two-component response regulator